MKPRTLALLLVASLLSGCSIGQPTPPQQRFKLRTDSDPIRKLNKDGQILNVRQANIAASFSDIQFTYRTGQDTFETDFYHIFLTPPANMITALTRNKMLSSGAFAEVIAPGGGMQPTANLSIDVNEFYGDFREGVAPAAVVSLRMVIKKHRQDAQPPWIDTFYRERVPLEERSPEGLVEAWQTALERILAKAARDARRKIPNREPSETPSETPSPTPKPSPTPRPTATPTPPPEQEADPEATPFGFTIFGVEDSLIEPDPIPTPTGSDQPSPE